MPSTYTTNLGIEKIATGEQSGTWGDTTNTNLDILDEAINGIITITAASAGSSGSPNTLPITDGASSNGRNKFIEITDGGDLGGDVFYQLTPNDAEKILFVRNSLTTQDLILFQGTYNASNDIVVPNGKDMLVKFDGAGASATVTDVFNDLRTTKIDPVTLSINGTDVTSTAAELNILDGVTATTAELNYNDITTLGTSEASKVVTADANGDITIAGASYNVVWDKSADALEFGDNAKAAFGAGSDMSIYHDGSNSYIVDSGTGNLKIAASQIDLLGGADGAETMATFADNGAVSLYYDNSAKLETTTNGVDITGRAEGTVTTDNDGGFDLNASNYFICTPSASLDISFTNETTGVAGAILLVNTTPQTITVDADVFLSDTDLTAINSAGTYLLGFYCPDGTNVYMSATPALTEGS